MLEKEWSYNVSKIVTWNQFSPLFVSYSNGGKHFATKGKIYWDNLKCVWKWNEPELLAPITSNKNIHESNNNLETMLSANAQLLK